MDYNDNEQDYDDDNYEIMIVMMTIIVRMMMMITMVTICSQARRLVGSSVTQELVF